MTDESLVPANSTCLTLGLSQKNICKACEIWKDNTRKGKKRQQCHKGWSNEYKNSSTVRFKRRYDLIWEELNNKEVAMDLGEEEVNQGRRRRSKRKRSETTNPPASLFSRFQSSAKKRFCGLIGRRDETNENVEVNNYEDIAEATSETNENVNVNNNEDIAEATRIEMRGIQTSTPIETRLEDDIASAGFLQTVQKSVLNGLSTIGSKIRNTFQAQNNIPFQGAQNNIPPVAPMNLELRFQGDRHLHLHSWHLNQQERFHTTNNRASRLYSDFRNQQAAPMHPNLSYQEPTPYPNMNLEQVHSPLDLHQAAGHQFRQQLPLNENLSEQYRISSLQPVPLHLQHSNANMPTDQEPCISDSDLARLFEEHGERLGFIKSFDGDYIKKEKWSTVINTSHKTKLQSSDEFVKRLRKYMKRERFEGREISKRLYGICAALSPNVSFASLEMTAGLSRAGLADDLSILSHLQAEIEDIPKISPGQDAIAEYIATVATDILFLLHLELTEEEIRVFLNCDKGQSDAFIKILSWWCKKKQKVKTAFLDIDKTGGTSAECARAIQFSTERLSIENFQYAGATTDSGGGGVGASLREELNVLQLIDALYYLTNFCGMHIVQLTFCTPCLKVLGMNGLNSRSALQAVFQLYYIQNETETIKYSKILAYICKEKGLTLKGMEDDVKNADYIMPSPVLTRWWTVGQAVRYILQNIEIFKEVPKYFIYGSTSTKISAAASDLFSLLKEKGIIADMKLINNFCVHYLHPAFQWFQGGDEELGGTPGFKCRHVFAQYFHLHSILKSWRHDGWKSESNMKSYKDYVEREGVEEAEGVDGKESTDWLIEEGGLENVEERDFNRTLQEEKSNQFFRLAQESLEKHFGRYGNDLVVYALFGEMQTAKIVARHLIGILPLLEESDAKKFMSSAQSHKKGSQVEINLESFAEFVAARVDNDDVIMKNMHLQRLNEKFDAIRKIANGLDVWNDETKSGDELREFYKTHYAALATTTHFVEAGVKAAKDADNKSRTETRMSHYGIACNAKLEINENTKASMIKAKSEKEEGKKQQYKDEDHLQARGKSKTIEAIKYVKKLHRTIEEKKKEPYYDQIYDQIQSKITTTESGFDLKRADENFQAFLETTQKRKEKGVRLTKAQRRAGYDVTPLLRGVVGFTDLRTIHLSLVKGELEARKIDFPTGKGIKAFRDALKITLLQKQMTDLLPILSQ